MRLLEGRTALVTGVGGGIGRGIALRFAEHGAAVALHCRTAVEQARTVADRIHDLGGRAVVLRGDLTDEDVCHRVVRVFSCASGDRQTCAVAPCAPWKSYTGNSHPLR
jgi:3-oxoacyl-[acyl-carrier protein] reductase